MNIQQESEQLAGTEKADKICSYSCPYNKYIC